MRRRVAIAAALLLALSGRAAAQGALDRTPNLQGVWGLEPAAAVFVLSHRFEVMEGGDELISVPTLTLAAGLPLGLTAGLDFTSYSEVVPETLTGNEAELWLKRPVPIGLVETSVLVGYNTAAESLDGALDVAFGAGRVRVLGEGRAFSSLFGRGDAEVAAAAGATVRLTRYLALVGDVGRVLTEDGVPAAWSGGVAMAIPMSPHTLSLVVTNTGATTLHGASRANVVGEGDVRYGFSFTVPVGGARWKRLFDPVREGEED